MERDVIRTEARNDLVARNPHIFIVSRIARPPRFDLRLTQQLTRRSKDDMLTGRCPRLVGIDADDHSVRLVPAADFVDAVLDSVEERACGENKRVAVDDVADESPLELSLKGAVAFVVVDNVVVLGVSVVLLPPSWLEQRWCVGTVRSVGPGAEEVSR